MRIYLVYAADLEGERCVASVFSEKEMAERYCKFWDRAEGPLCYFIREMELDSDKEFIEFIEKVG